MNARDSRGTSVWLACILLTLGGCDRGRASAPAAPPASPPTATPPPATPAGGTPARTPTAGSTDAAAAGATAARPTAAPAPTLPDEGLHAAEVSGNCLRLETGAVYCWGTNASGELGIGQPPISPTNRPGTPVQGLTDAQQVSCNRNSCCALRTGGAVVCWGANDYGQIGDGTKVGRTAPVPNGITDATAVTMGTISGCALRTGGRVSCWGGNPWGQLGDAAPEHLHPVEIQGFPAPLVQIASGDHTVCGRTEPGQVYCWGSNNWNRLAHTFATVTMRSNTPIDVTGLADAIDLSGAEEHFCAVRRSGEVVCWGKGESGALGNGTETTTNVAPVTVTGVAGAVQVSAGGHQGCARLASGQVLCWGANWRAQLGDATFTGRSRSTAAPVPGLTDATGVFSRNHAGSCARRRSGVMLCWGGDAGVGSWNNTPTPAALAAIP